MAYTKEWLREALAKNPALSASIQAGRVDTDMPLEQSKKPAKYRNTKVYEYADGFISLEKDCESHGKTITVYDSVKEYQRWIDLQFLEKTGKVSNLSRQTELLIQEEFMYQGKKIRKITYKADFQYTKNGVVVVEDTKAFDKNTKRYLTTEEFRLKWKLLKHRYPEIQFIIQ